MEHTNLNYNTKLSFIAAIPRPDVNYVNRYSPFARFMWQLYKYLGHLCLGLAICTISIPLLLGLNDFGNGCAASMSLCYCIQPTLKITLLYLRGEVFTDIVERLERLSKELMMNPMKDESYPDLCEQFYGKVKKFANAKLIFENACYFLILPYYITLAQLDEGDTSYYPIKMYWPFNADSKYFSPFGLTYFNFIFYIGTLRNTVSDIHFISILVIIGGQLRYLRQLLGTIYDDCAYDRRITFGTNDYSVDTDLYLQSQDSRTKELTHWWLKRHKEIFDILNTFQTISIPYICITYLIVMCNLFLGGMIMISDPEMDVVVKNFIYVNLFGCALQLLVVSIAADFLFEESEEVASEGLSEKLLSGPPLMKKWYLGILSRTSRPVRFTVGGLYPLGCATYHALVTSTFSFFITIMQLKDSSENAE